MARVYKPTIIIPEADDLPYVDPDLHDTDVGNTDKIIKMLSSTPFMRGWWDTAKRFLKDPRIIELIKEDRWDEIFENWGTAQRGNKQFGINHSWTTVVLADILYWLGFNFWDYLVNDDDFYTKRYEFEFNYED